MSKDNRDWDIDIIEINVKSIISIDRLNKVINFLLLKLKDQKIGKNVSELSLTLCDDSHIQTLNKEHRGKDKATDVLSFPMLSDFDCELTFSLGDIVISLDTTIRQAKELEISKEKRFYQLLIHGLLHLYGYDHENVSTEEKEEMERLEDKLLESLNSETKFL